MTLYVHSIEIVSEHESYAELEDLASDAISGDARLRSWIKTPLPEGQWESEDEREFFTTA